MTLEPLLLVPLYVKVFEHCLLDIYGDLLKSADNQFGFKKGLGCTHAIHNARKIIDHFTYYGSIVNLCATDLSRTFDKVDLFAFFIKLINKKYSVSC